MEVFIRAADPRAGNEWSHAGTAPAGVVVPSREPRRPPVAYAGVGSRGAPPEVLVECREVARILAERGLTLRTGHAPGCDQAFEAGAGVAAEVYLPWPGFEGDVPILASFTLPRPLTRATDIAAQLHPAFGRLSRGARALHARNCHQVLGALLNDPVDFLVCWTPGGVVRGGTATAIRLAERHDIPVLNMGAGPIWERLASLLM